MSGPLTFKAGHIVGISIREVFPRSQTVAVIQQWRIKEVLDGGLYDCASCNIVSVQNESPFAKDSRLLMSRAERR